MYWYVAALIARHSGRKVCRKSNFIKTEVWKICWLSRPFYYIVPVNFHLFIYFKYVFGIYLFISVFIPEWPIPTFISSIFRGSAGLALPLPDCVSAPPISPTQNAHCFWRRQLERVETILLSSAFSSFPFSLHHQG